MIVGTTALIRRKAWSSPTLALSSLTSSIVLAFERRLQSKTDLQPHVLVMSAAPSPRSLALTIYGDLDVSIIDEMPPGREPVNEDLCAGRTRATLFVHSPRGRCGACSPPSSTRWWKRARVVDPAAAVEEHAGLSTEIFPDLSLGLLMDISGGEKAGDAGLSEGEHDVLVSTTVIEVGIDVTRR